MLMFVNVISEVIDKVIGIVGLVIMYLQYKKSGSPEPRHSDEPRNTGHQC